MKSIRFTDESRGSVKAAFEEARMLGQAAMSISPETLEDRLFELRGHEVG